MRIRFSPEVLADTRSWRSLDRMVMHFEDGRHDWLADNPLEIEASAWLQDAGRAGEMSRKALQEHVRMAAYPKNRAVLTVALVTASDRVLSADDALRAMEAPVHIAVENVGADGGFLVSFLLALNRTALWEAWEEDWLSVEHMGGYTSVEVMIAHLRDRIPGPCRVFVMTDSDARFPGEVTDTHRTVTAACSAAGVPYAILEKRKIENYLPVSVLNRLALSEQRTVFRAFLHLNGDQRSHYEMKHGFADDGRGNAIVPLEQTTLFAGVRGAVLQDLRGGFGRHVAARFVEDRQRITEQDIRQVCECNPTELDRILDEIERLL